ncbi:MAG TPA: phosphohistidine phosphatase SixA [Pyrinomonadaceae bacterium]|nr:phosphohistidine phosphatase SixA [Pyrinomonadaceae bacterium]
MKKLYILRHAKSSWDNPILADFDRPLNERGTKTADFMGNFLLKQDFQPDLILTSPATRAQETANIVKKTAKFQAEIKLEENIYEASVQTLVKIVSELKENVQTVLLVGHNPGLEGLIKFLTGEIQSMPTAGLAIIDLKIEKWKEIAAECGTLQDLVRPKMEIKKSDSD